MLAPYAALNSNEFPIWPVLSGLGGALGSGIAYTLVRKLTVTEHPSVIVLYFPMVCLPGTLLLGSTILSGRVLTAGGCYWGGLFYATGSTGLDQGHAA